MAIFVDENTKVSSRASPAARAASTACATGTTAPRSSAGVTPGKGGHRRRGHPGLRHRWPTRSRPPAPTPRSSSCRPRPRRPPSSRRPTAGIEFIVVHHRGHPGPGRGAVLQHAAARLPRHAACSARTAPASSAPASATSASPPARSPQPGGPGRHRQPLGHAHLPGALRAEAEGHRRDHVRRHRRRPGAGHDRSSTAWRRSRPTPTRRR